MKKGVNALNVFVSLFVLRAEALSYEAEALSYGDETLKTIKLKEKII